MRRLLRLAVLAFGVAWLAIAGFGAKSFNADAARDQTTPVAGVVSQEIVVFEVDNCAYCGLFRDHVLPRYRQTPRAGELPIRFVDVNAVGADAMKLAAPIQLVPTVVMMRGGQEVDRLAGYTGPENFFLLVSRMLKGE